MGAVPARAHRPRGAALIDMSANQTMMDADTHNEFAIALTKRLLHAPGNVFWCPLGVRAAFAMAHAGARGETAAEMSNVLHLGEGARIHVAQCRIGRQLSSELFGNR
jgi:serine protease inhibitor